MASAAGVARELRNRGVKDIYLVCVDGLKGFPQAIEAVFPKAQVLLRSAARNPSQSFSFRMTGDSFLVAWQGYRRRRVPQSCEGSGGFPQSCGREYRPVRNRFFRA
jgi:hypothetical protein